MKTNKNNKKTITRKEALKKIGFGAVTAGTFMALMNTPKKAAAGSPSPTSAPTPNNGYPWD